MFSKKRMYAVELVVSGSLFIFLTFSSSHSIQHLSLSLYISLIILYLDLCLRNIVSWTHGAIVMYNPCQLIISLFNAIMSLNVKNVIYLSCLNIYSLRELSSLMEKIFLWSAFLSSMMQNRIFSDVLPKSLEIYK